MKVIRHRKIYPNLFYSFLLCLVKSPNTLGNDKFAIEAQLIVYYSKAKYSSSKYKL